MRKLIVFAASLMMTLPGWAQLPSQPMSESPGSERKVSPLAHVYEQYGSRPNVSSIYISAEMFGLISAVTEDGTVSISAGQMDVDGNDISEVLTLMDRLRGMYILSTDDPEQATSLFHVMSMTLDTKDYTMLMKVTDDGENMVFYYRSPDKKQVEEFVMLESVKDGNRVTSSIVSCSVIQFEAENLTVKDIAALAAEMTKDSE